LVYLPGTYNYYPKITFIKAILKSLVFGFGLIREDWLAFAYMGGVLLLASYSWSWLKPFSFFSYAGKMALTNYMLQAILFSFFYKYAIMLQVSSQSFVPLVVVLVFGMLVLLSWWWLNRYQFGPLEWFWRSFTYWKWQPMKKKETIFVNPV